MGYNEIEPNSMDPNLWPIWRQPFDGDMITAIWSGHALQHDYDTLAIMCLCVLIFC